MTKPVTRHGEVTIRQAADGIGVTVQTIHRWISQGRLRAFRYGPRTIRILLEDLEALREEVNPITYEHVNGGDRA